jgi:hypothetical protein
MKFYILAFTFLISCGTVGQASEDLALDYNYTRGPSDPSLAKLKGPIKIASFGDTRVVEDNRLISDDVQVEAPVAEIVSAAFVQAFKSNGATLAEEDVRFTLEGALTELNTTTKDGGVEIQLRAKVVLKDSGRTVWENVLFSRSTGENAAEAMRASLSKLVQELLLDDYFLMEII